MAYERHMKAMDALRGEETAHFKAINDGSEAILQQINMEFDMRLIGDVESSKRWKAELFRVERARKVAGIYFNAERKKLQDAWQMELRKAYREQLAEEAK